MREKGCVLDVVQWKRARCFLYWRLRRLLAQHAAVDRLLEANSSLAVGQAEAMLRRWFVEERGPADSYLWDENEPVVRWLEAQRADGNSTVARNLLAVRRDARLERVRRSLNDCPDIAMDAVVELARKLNPHQKAELIRTLSQLELEAASDAQPASADPDPDADT